MSSKEYESKIHEMKPEELMEEWARVCGKLKKYFNIEETGRKPVRSIRVSSHCVLFR